MHCLKKRTQLHKKKINKQSTQTNNGKHGNIFRKSAEEHAVKHGSCRHAKKRHCHKENRNSFKCTGEKQPSFFFVSPGYVSRKKRHKRTGNTRRKKSGDAFNGSARRHI